MKKKLKAKVIQVPAEAVNRIDPAELEKCEACAAEMVVAPYEPMDFFNNPVDSYDVVERLYPYMERMDVAHAILSDNGMVNTLDGHIKGYNDSRFAAIIPAGPITEAGKTSALIVNTLNNGFSLPVGLQAVNATIKKQIIKHFQSVCLLILPKG